jgi:hypothetical protein
MNLRTLPIDMTLDALYQERIFTVAALTASSASVPLVTPYIAPFTALMTSWLKVQDAEHALTEASTNADAKVDVVDAVLNGEVIAISHAVLTAVKNDRTADLYVHYFGTFRPMDLKHPIRDGHLATLNAWVPSLIASAVQALKAAGTSLQATLADADTATKAKAAADQALTDFSVLGDRKAFVDSMNALRKSTYGDLAEMPHAHPELNLPVAFADGFFLHGATVKLPTMARLDQKIASLQSKLNALQTQKSDLEAEDAAAAKAAADADATATATALKAAEDEIAAATAKAAALKAKLDPTASTPAATATTTATTPGSTAPVTTTATTTASAVPTTPTAAAAATNTTATAPVASPASTTTSPAIPSASHTS